MAEDRPFVLGLDLDGVCGDYPLALREVLAKKRGIEPKSLPLEVSWNFPEWDLSIPQYLELHESAVKEHGIFLNMPVIEGASEALWELSNSGIWIRIISHRLLVNWTHQRAAQDTVIWLDKSDIPYRELCFIGRKTAVGADAYIEDSPANIDSLRKLGKTVIVYTQPYNRDLDGPRAENWQQAKEIVLDMALKAKGSQQGMLPDIDFGNSHLSGF